MTSATGLNDRSEVVGTGPNFDPVFLRHNGLEVIQETNGSFLPATALNNRGEVLLATQGSPFDAEVVYFFNGFMGSVPGTDSMSSAAAITNWCDKVRRLDPGSPYGSGLDLHDAGSSRRERAT